MLSSWDAFASPLFISAVADCSLFWQRTAGLSLLCGLEYGCARWGKHGVFRMSETSVECIASPCRMSPCLHCELLGTMQPMWTNTIKCSVVQPGVSWVDPRGPMSRYDTDIPTPASKEGHDGRQRTGQPDKRSHHNAKRSSAQGGEGS